ncbi:MAG TPA: Ig-like domain-containing protein, partial [Tepidisphaeraceae bacterium]
MRAQFEVLESRQLLSLVAAYGFDEGAGTLVHDVSGTGNDGAVNNVLWSAAGKFGGAMQFAGATNSFVQVADNPSFHLASGMTLEAWVRPSSLNSPDNGWCAAIAKDHRNSSNDISYALYSARGNNTPPSSHIQVGQTDYGTTGGTRLSLNTWYFLASTYDGKTLRTYVNGTQIGSKNITGTIAVTTDALKIGGDWSGEMFTGLIDNVRIYNSALAQAAIQTDMNTAVVPPVQDTQPPTAPSNVVAAGSLGQVNLSWGASSDDVGVTGYQVYRSTSSGFTPSVSNQIATTTALSYRDTVAPGTYYYLVTATDAAGNQSAASNEASGVSAADQTPPSVAITAPADGSTISGTVSVSASASDNVGVVGVQFQLDGSNLGAEDASAPYTISWNTTGLSGPHSLTAIARDAVGNSATSLVTTVTVDNADHTPPTVSLTAPANNSTAKGAVNVAASASDNVGVIGVQFQINGADLGSEDLTSPYQVSWDTTAYPNDTYTLTAVARDAAGNKTTSAVRSVIVNNPTTDPAAVGQWSPVMDWPLVAINMALLDTGKILMWDGGPDCIGAISATVWDPATNTFTPTPSETQQEVRDIFCSALTVLADGKVLVAGGHECLDPSFVGSAIGNLFDPATQTWTKLPDMNYRRWYPTATTLPDGRALVTAGADTGNLAYIPIPEIYDEQTNTWTKLTSANRTIPDYPFMFVLPDGRVIAAGSDEAKMATSVLDLKTQTWTTVDPTILDAGSAVMYLPGKIMKAGSSYLSDPADNGGNIPSAATTYVLDTTGANPIWQQTASMANARTHLNLTVLPDGNVIATGGSSVIGGINPATAVYAAEMWSPTTQTWTTMASEQISRMYHSTALLLPDGR